MNSCEQWLRVVNRYSQFFRVVYSSSQCHISSHLFTFLHKYVHKFVLRFIHNFFHKYVHKYVHKSTNMLKNMFTNMLTNMLLYLRKCISANKSPKYILLKSQYWISCMFRIFEYLLWLLMLISAKSDNPASCNICSF